MQICTLYQLSEWTQVVFFYYRQTYPTTTSVIATTHTAVRVSLVPEINLMHSSLQEQHTHTHTITTHVHTHTVIYAFCSMPSFLYLAVP